MRAFPARMSLPDSCAPLLWPDSLNLSTSLNRSRDATSQKRNARMTLPRWTILPLVAALAMHSFQQATAQGTADSVAGKRKGFTSESLGMPRTQIALTD